MVGSSVLDWQVSLSGLVVASYQFEEPKAGVIETMIACSITACYKALRSDQND